jgi:glycosyltransferase involved in cell wall biosynthesis
MKILWMTWKDLKNPAAGGAEVVNEQLAKRLVRDGHEVIILTAGFSGAKPEEIVDGYEVIRLGSRYSIYWRAFRYYRKNLTGWADLVIDEMNTVPFFAKFYVQEPSIMFAYQLCRQVWFYQIMFPVSLIGYWIEPLYLRLLSGQKMITESISAKQDMMRFGFSENNIHVITMGSDVKPTKSLDSIKKFTDPTLLCLGAMRPMKRSLDIVAAFELAKPQIPTLKLVLAGDNAGKYGDRVMQAIASSPYKTDISYKGRVSKEDKLTLMGRAHVIMVASVKEGWGLIVTEANSQGTPAVVYDVDGLRDSVREGVTGLVTKVNTPAALATSLGELLSDAKLYDKMRHSAYDWSKTMTYEKGYQEFLEAIKV